MTRTILFAATLLAACVVGAAARAGPPPLRATPPEWDFGAVERAAGVVSKDLLLENNTGEEITVSLVSTCECLRASPSSVRIPGGGAASVTLAFDPREDEGDVEKDIIVRTTLPEVPKSLYLVRGRVDAGKGGRIGGVAGGGTSTGVARPSDEPWEWETEDGGDADLRLDLFSSPGCRTCRRIVARTIPEAERRTGLRVSVTQRDILDPGVYERYRRLIASLGEEERAYPALVVGRRVLQGGKEISEGLVGALEETRAEASRGQGRPRAGEPAPEIDAAGPAHRLPEPAGSRMGEGLAVLPVLAAGLLDGVNPCAFTTLIFLLSALAAAGRSRREVFQLGVFFTFAVFATYLSIGMGVFQAVRAAGAFPTVARLIKWVLILALIGLCGMSVHDYFAVRAGRSREMLLQLPRSIKRRIHESVRGRVRTATLATSAIALGFLIALFELACTGQVYLPTIVYIVRVQRRVGAFLLLLAYNLGFIAPLIAVFGLSYWGTSSRALAGVFQRSLKGVKLAMAFLFLGLAAATYFT